MSFHVQESLMLALLFNEQKRTAFCDNQSAFLSNYDLTDSEKADFMTVRTDALLFDAALRNNILLGQMCKAYPLSISLITSLENGFALLKAQIDEDFINEPAQQRVVFFGRRLFSAIEHDWFDSEQQADRFFQILSAEAHMQWSKAELFNEVRENGPNSIPQPELKHDFMSAPVRVAAFTSASVLPQPFNRLTELLCPVDNDLLWKHLRQAPTTNETRSQVLDNPDERCFIAKAKVLAHFDCEGIIEHDTMELSGGFVPLMEQVDMTLSIAEILHGMANAGADIDLLAKIEQGFVNLLKQGMIETF